MLLPSLARAKRRAQQIGCTSNLRQDGIAVKMFADDNGDFCPPGNGLLKDGIAGEPLGLSGGVNPIYTADPSQDEQLGYSIGSYLGLPNPGNTSTNVVATLTCPGATPSANPLTNVYFVVSQGNANAGNGLLTNNGATVWLPFGYSGGQPENVPHKIGDIPAHAQYRFLPCGCWPMPTSTRIPATPPCFPSPRTAPFAILYTSTTMLAPAKLVHPAPAGWIPTAPNDISLHPQFNHCVIKLMFQPTNPKL
jgi:hypothetical protein